MRALRGVVAAELLLGFTILGIVAATAVPAVNLLAARSHHRERAVVLDGLNASLDHYYRARGTYPVGRGLRNPPGVAPGIPAPWNPSMGSWRTLAYLPDGPVSYRYRYWSWPEGAPDTYLIEAVGDVDRDGVESHYWELWSHGKRLYVGDLRPEE